MASTIRIAILANAAKAKAEMQSVGRESSKLGSVLKAGIVGGAVVAGAALATMAASAISGARESAEIHRVLENQISNMGATARTAFSGATKFAEDYGKAIGKDDDDILKVVNKLSTFPAAFGKGTLGAEGMRRATQAAFDLEAAGIGTAEGNIVGLGKALDNPIKGLTALSKSGVSFTEEQKKQITNFTKQGKLAEAQKVLLAGIETNAKGAATQQADGLSRAKVALDGMAEGLASKLLPYLDKFGNFFVDKALPAIEKGLDAVGKAIGPIVKGVSSFISKLTSGGPGKDSGVMKFFGSLKKFADEVFPVIKQNWQDIADKALPVLRDIGTKINDDILPALSAFVDAITPLVAAFEEKIGPIVSKVMEAVLKVIQGALDVIGGIIKVFTGILTGDWSTAWEGVKQIFSGVWDALVALLGVALETVKTQMSMAWEVLKTLTRKAWNALKDKVSTTWESILKKVKGIPKKITDALGDTKKLLVSAGENIVNGLWDGVKSMGSWISTKVSNFITDNITGPIRSALQIFSPSRVMRDLGKYIPMGLALGIDDASSKVKTATANMTAATVPSVSSVSTSQVSNNRRTSESVRLELSNSSSGAGALILALLKEEVRKGGGIKAVFG